MSPVLFCTIFTVVVVCNCETLLMVFSAHPHYSKENVKFYVRCWSRSYPSKSETTWNSTSQQTNFIFHFSFHGYWTRSGPMAFFELFLYIHFSHLSNLLRSCRILSLHHLTRDDDDLFLDSLELFTRRLFILFFCLKLFIRI